MNFFEKIIELVNQFLAFYMSQVIVLRILLTLIVFFVLSSILVFIYLFIVRSARASVKSRRLKLSDKYLTMLSAYAFEETLKINDFTRIKNKFRRAVLYDVIMHFHANLSGETADLVRQLFLDLNFDKECRKLALSGNPDIRAKAISDINQMVVPLGLLELTKVIFDRREFLSMQAMMANIKLQPTNPVNFLHTYLYPISEWTQINLYYALKNEKDIVIPVFSQLFNSVNSYVVVFAIRMTALFGQFDSYEQAKKLLFHQNKHIRRAVIYLLHEFNFVDSSADLKLAYVNEKLENKKYLVEYFIKNPSEENLEFLTTALSKERNPHLQFLLIEGIFVIGDVGKDVLNELLNATTTSANLKNQINYLLRDK